MPCFFKLFLTGVDVAQSCIEVRNDLGETICRKNIGLFEGFQQLGRNEFLIAADKRFSVDSNGELQEASHNDVNTSYNLDA